MFAAARMVNPSATNLSTITLFCFDLRPLEVTIVDPHTGHLLWQTWRISGSIHPELAWDSIPLVVDFFKCIYQALYGFMRLSVDWSPRKNKTNRWNVWFHRIKFEMFRLWVQPGMTRKPVTERKVNSNLAHNRHSGDQVIWPLLSFFEPDVFAGNTVPRNHEPTKTYKHWVWVFCPRMPHREKVALSLESVKVVYVSQRNIHGTVPIYHFT